MYNPVHISNNFLMLAHKQDEQVTAMKMQKMLYFLYRDFLREFKVSLFSERFSAWKYGPVLESVYHTYKGFGSDGIKGYGGTPAYALKEEDDPDLRRLIRKIWAACLPYNGIDLSKMTHRPESAWYKAWNRSRTYLQEEDIFNDTVEIG